jgi:DNA repair protein RecN (Recombination protein N)
LRDQLAAKDLSEEERLQRLDIIRFQLEEIENAKLTPGEEAELEQRLPELKNAEKLQSLSAAAYGTLYENEGSALERLGQAEKAFESLQSLAPSVGALAQELAEAASRLRDVAHNLRDLTDRWQADPEMLESSLRRLDLFARLKKKYGGTIESIIEKAVALRSELDRLENADAHRQDLTHRVTRAENELRKAAADLSSQRKKAAKQLSAAVQKELGDLGLQRAIFNCQIETLAPESVQTTGADAVIFQWSPNVGEGMQPLKSIASGGEMSRVMLAIKSVLAKADPAATLVFDEIDAGIGGLTAQSVGRKLRALARHRQVLCVSHLPQIAACASALRLTSKSPNAFPNHAHSR